MRIKFINSGLALGFLVLFLGLFNLQVVNGKKFKELSNKNCIRLLPQVGMRGNILDRQGNVIVGNRLSYNAMILPHQINQRGNSVTIADEVLINVSRILGISPEELKKRFKDEFIASFAPVTIAENIDLNKAIALEELKPEFPAILIQPYPQRIYPHGRLACHIIGYLGYIDHWRLTKLKDFGYKTKDIVGFGGVEEKYDYYLRQEEGGMQVVVDHLGRFMRVLGFKPSKNGKDIQLTLDLKMQEIVENNLGNRIGSVIIMDPYTGEILAMASSPTFNASMFMGKSESYLRNLFNDPEAPLINRCISGVYPAGSVFKLIAAVSAIETGKINLSTTFFCPGSINIGNRKFSCWNTHNRQNLFDAITHSCNVFFYRTGLLLGPQLIHDYASRFGFGRISFIDLPYEASGLLPHPLRRKIYKLQNWFDGDTANFAIGQGDLLVTPIQITRMMAIFANKGFLVSPYLVKSVDGRDLYHRQQKAVRVNIKENTIDNIRQALRRVVLSPDGTANILSDLDIPIAGKTGTAQVFGRQAHAWFVGFLPFKDPKFVICTFIEHGGSGAVSCALTKEIIKEMIRGGLI